MWAIPLPIAAPKAVGGGGGSGTVWDAATAGSSIVLSNGNKTAAKPSGATAWSNGNVRGNASKAAGKLYFEVKFDSVTGGGDTCIGVATSLWTYAASYVGSDQYGWSEYGEPAIAGFIHNSAFSGPANTYATGDVGMVFVDFAAGAVWFGKNGTWLSGNPALGTSPAFTGLPGPLYPLYPAFSAYQAGHTVTLRTLLADFSYTIPVGGAAWG